MFVYVLYRDLTGRRYIGHTNDLNKRLKEHNAGRVKSTKTGLPWRIIAYKKHSLRSEARWVERSLKHSKNLWTNFWVSDPEGRKRRYEASFLSKLSDAEAEGAETQVWLEFAVQCGYLEVEVGQELSASYDNILGKIVILINNPQPWLLPGAKRR